MGFSLGDLILSATLIANAVAILNDERFLKKCLRRSTHLTHTPLLCPQLTRARLCVCMQTAGAMCRATSPTAP